MLKLYVQDFLRYRYLLYNLISRDFKLKYRRSVLGVAWSVLNPLMMCAVMFVIFNTLMAGMRGEGIENFAVYLVIGQLLFNFFRESTTMAMSSVMNNAMLLRKVYIPKYIFPLQKICFGLVNCLFSFIALIIVMIITRARLYPTILWAVPAAYAGGIQLGHWYDSGRHGGVLPGCDPSVGGVHHHPHVVLRHLLHPRTVRQCPAGRRDRPESPVPVHHRFP